MGGIEAMKGAGVAVAMFRALCASLLFLVSLPAVYAQVTMEEPFTFFSAASTDAPGINVDISDPNPEVEGNAVYRGVNENGDQVFFLREIAYSVTAEEYVEAVEAAAASGLFPGLVSLLASGGINLSGGNLVITNGVAWENDFSIDESSLGACYPTNADEELEGFYTTFVTCNSRVRDELGAAYLTDEYGPVVLAEDVGGGWCSHDFAIVSYAMNPTVEDGVLYLSVEGPEEVEGVYWVWEDDAMGGAYEGPCASTGPEVSASPMVAPNVFLFLPTGRNQTQETVGYYPTPKRPSRAFNAAEQTAIVQNLAEAIDDIEEEEDEITLTYQGSAYLGYPGFPSSPGYSSSDPTPPDDEGEGDGDGVNDIVEYCAANPNAVICDQRDLTGEGELSGALGELASAQGDAEGLLDTLVGDFGSFIPGMGPEIGPGVTLCPLADGIEVEGSDIVLDMTGVCDVMGGPVRTIMGLLAMVSAAVIVLRGISS